MLLMSIVCINCSRQYFKDHSHSILSSFDHRQNFPQIEGTLKIIPYKERKTPEIIINHKGTRMVKEGGLHGLQTTKLKNLGLTFQTVQQLMFTFELLS